VCLESETDPGMTSSSSVLRPVKGSHFLNVDIGLLVEKLRTPIKSVLAGQSQDGEVVLPAVNRRGRPIERRVQFSPLSRGGDGAAGVIMLMEPQAAS